MKKTLLVSGILLSLSLISFGVANAAITSVRQLSETCLTTPSTCNAEENAFLDGQKATQNSSPDDQGQAAQLNNQGVNAKANPATQMPPATQTTQPAAPSQPVSNTPGQNLGYTPLEPIPGVTTGANGTVDFPTLLGNIYKIAITIGALFSVLMLTVSGIRYMLSDVVTDKERAKKRITACLYGLVLIAISWLILNTINPQLVTFTLNPGTGAVTGPAQNSTAGGSTAGGSGAQRPMTSEELQQYLSTAYCVANPAYCAGSGIRYVGKWFFSN